MKRYFYQRFSLLVSPVSCRSWQRRNISTIPTPNAYSEPFDRYESGGYHPVHIGDVFRNRYRVVRKLGFGASSTVWLARDTLQPRYVALKVAVAKPRSPACERESLQMLSSDKIDHPGKVHVQKLIDTFEHVGPNGTHNCFVFEPAGRTLKYVLWDSEGNDRETGRYSLRWSLSFSRRVSRQLMLGLDFLHSHRIMHRNLHLENLLMRLQQPINDLKPYELQPRFYGIEDDTIMYPPGIYRRHHFSDDAHPAYVVEPKAIDDGSVTDFAVIITDLDNAVGFNESEVLSDATPIDKRAPEIVVTYNLAPNPKSEIWNLSCLIYHLITLNDMFTVPYFRDNTNEEMDDDYLCEVFDHLGAPPPQIASAWSRARQYFNPDWTYIDPKRDESGFSIRRRLEDEKPPGMSSQEFEDFLAFLEATLRWDPSERLDTKQILRLPWFTRDYDSPP